MTWSQFLELAHPESVRKIDSTRGMVWKINRFIGLRLAYVFYSVGISANFVSAIRFVIAFGAIFLLSRALEQKVGLTILGTLLMIIQVNLDFADGSIARVSGSTGEIGQWMDSLANSAGRLGMIVLFGYFTRLEFLGWLALFSGFVLTLFWDVTRNSAAPSWALNKLFRLSSSVVFVLIVLPIVITIFTFAKFPLTILSDVVTIGYGLLAGLWLLFLCVRKTVKKD